MQQRDYNKEMRDAMEHKYTYDFDVSVMHPFMLKSFKPFFKSGNLLELGSFQGNFTKLFLPHFNDITCLEASDEAIQIARQQLGARVNIIHGTFETANLPRKYDNIILTHVLEHLDDPIEVMKKVNNEWLSDHGRFFQSP